MQSLAPGRRFGRAGEPVAVLCDPMLAAVAAAVLIHLLLLLGLGVELPEPAPPVVRTFEVMTLEQPATTAAARLVEAVPADVDRAGETDLPLPELASGMAAAAPVLPDGPAPAELALEVPPAPAEDAAAPESVEPTEPAAPRRGPEPGGDAAAAGGFSEARFDTRPDIRPDIRPASLTEILRGVGADIAVPSLPSPAASPARAPDARASDVFASRSAEIAALAARINAWDKSQAGRPRRKAISTNTREYRYAAYMEAWRRKVEAIGNLNYPQAAKEHGLFGSLILHVGIKADGDLERVRVVRSSGHEVLDEAAIRIVKLAAPFAPFPESIKDETDVLDITRVWQFQHNHRLGWD